jgi:hypothetical protein
MLSFLLRNIWLFPSLSFFALHFADLQIVSKDTCIFLVTSSLVDFLVSQVLTEYMWDVILEFPSARYGLSFLPCYDDGTSTAKMMTAITTTICKIFATASSINFVNSDFILQEYVPELSIPVHELNSDRVITLHYLLNTIQHDICTTKILQPAQGPTQPFVNWVPEAVSPKAKWWRHKVDRSPHVLLRSRMVKLYIHSLTCLHGVMSN